MDAKEFKKIISTQGMYKMDDCGIYNVKDNGKCYIYKTDYTELVKNSSIKLIGVYDEKLDLLMNANMLVESYTKKYKAKIRETKKSGEFDFEKEKASISPICNVLNSKGVAEYVEFEVNKKVEAYITKTYDKTVTEHENFTKRDKENFARIRESEDIARFLETGPNPIPYKPTFSINSTLDYKQLEEFFTDKKKFIDAMYDKYIDRCEVVEHRNLVAAHLKDLAAADMMNKKDHPAHLKRQIHYVLNKSFKEVTLELNKTDEAGKNIILTAPTKVLSDPSYVDGFSTWALGYESQKNVKKLYPELEEVKYEDIKKIKHGNAVLFEDAYFTKP